LSKIAAERVLEVVHHSFIERVVEILELGISFQVRNIFVFKTLFTKNTL